MSSALSLSSTGARGRPNLHRGTQHPHQTLSSATSTPRSAPTYTGATGHIRGHEEERTRGQFKNPGRVWSPAGTPPRVKVHDFPDPTARKAIPYGNYDLGRKHGVEVDVDHDTAAFAVAAIRAWWYGDGTTAYPKVIRKLRRMSGGVSVTASCAVISKRRYRR